MIVLIDKPRNGWCHLVGDTIPNLHKFANEINIKKCWFENKRGKHQPHYDVREEHLDKAIKHGAILVSSKKIVSFLKERYLL